MKTGATRTPQPHDGEPPACPPPRWRGWLELSWVRTAAGVLVLAAIVGGLVAIDLVGGDAETGPLDSRAPVVGEPAPQFALSDVDGNVRLLSDYRGEPVWINFWATWCGPCRRELPDIQRLANEFEDQGLVVLALNFRQSAEEAAEFWQELGLDLPLLLDKSGSVGDQYRLFGMPNNFFIAGDGTLRSRHLGFLTEGQMREALAGVGLE